MAGYELFFSFFYLSFSVSLAAQLNRIFGGIQQTSQREPCIRASSCTADAGFVQAGVSPRLCLEEVSGI